MVVLYQGCTGDNVRVIQEALGIDVDGIFGPITEHFVKEYQKNKGLWSDGIVGPKTWTMLQLATTDKQEADSQPEHFADLDIRNHYLPKGEYLEGPTKKGVSVSASHSRMAKYLGVCPKLCNRVKVND